MDNQAVLAAVLFLFKIYFTDGCQTTLQDRLDVYFIKSIYGITLGRRTEKKGRRERTFII